MGTLPTVRRVGYAPAQYRANLALSYRHTGLPHDDRMVVTDYGMSESSDFCWHPRNGDVASGLCGSFLGEHTNRMATANTLSIRLVLSPSSALLKTCVDQFDADPVGDMDNLQKQRVDDRAIRRGQIKRGELDPASQVSSRPVSHRHDPICVTGKAEFEDLTMAHTHVPGRPHLSPRLG